MNFQIDNQIPYNYTSASDTQIVSHLFGHQFWQSLKKLNREKDNNLFVIQIKKFVGELFMVRRNPYVYESLVSSKNNAKQFFISAQNHFQSLENPLWQTSEHNVITQSCQEKLDFLKREIEEIPQKRIKIKKALGAIIGRSNILFDPYTITAHITDASGWRLYAPMGVVYPEKEEQVPPLVKAIGALALKIIPRGAGTGLTGGAVPTDSGCLIINLEKLNKIRGIYDFSERHQKNQKIGHQIIEVEAGAITNDVIQFAAEKNLVFATDPTSAWSCTIGGNISENAGGKTAVLWGTAFDNILSYKICMPNGETRCVKRQEHPFRKIMPDEKVIFEISDSQSAKPQIIELLGTEIRKKGLGKDITNKALKGLPGIQKEGTDGIITSAKFVLYRAFPFKQTCCLEFFGEDMDEASRVIQDIVHAFPQKNDTVFLMALEHFDEEYVKAIGYKVKAPISERPMAVILLDLVTYEAAHLKTGLSRLDNIIQNYTRSYIFIAKNMQEAEKFWSDRKKLGAIAARTNAFKLNEDIVLPIESLAEFASYVDDYNVEEDRYNQKEFVWEISNYLQYIKTIDTHSEIQSKLPKAMESFRQFIEIIDLAGKENLQSETQINTMMQQLEDSFHGYDALLTKFKNILLETRSKRIVIGTHMHAGDGNVHVNIPVFANDKEMLIRAFETADAIMEKAVELEGVVSGEHGIGFTKLKYLDAERISELNSYRKQIDPNGRMNPGKLSEPEIPDRIFTPSFELLNLESQILQQYQIMEIAQTISQCVRCGRCKTDCSMFYPQENLFFHPRNKNLSLIAIIEAMLFHAQYSSVFDSPFLKYLENISDHCTLCHKCKKHCPINIDTGELSVMTREILSQNRLKKNHLPVLLSLGYLASQSTLYNTFFRYFFLKWGGRIQNIFSYIYRIMSSETGTKNFYSIQLLDTPIPKPANHPLCRFLPDRKENDAIILEPIGDVTSTVFYFPGCGSERLYSQISLATIFVLLHQKIRVILPPAHYCCGIPFQSNAKIKIHTRIRIRNLIMLNSIKKTLRYPVAACIVSCGTCLEALRNLQIENIFTCRLVDVCEFVLDDAISINPAESAFYHQPCHDSLNGQALELYNKNKKAVLHKIAYCCSEAGTLALNHPHIASALRKRKTITLKNKMKENPSVSKLITNCPACLQGLGRIVDNSIQLQHMIEVLAENIAGKNWQENFTRIWSSYEKISL